MRGKRYHYTWDFQDYLIAFFIAIGLALGTVFLAAACTILVRWMGHTAGWW